MHTILRMKKLRSGSERLFFYVAALCAWIIHEKHCDPKKISLVAYKKPVATS